LILGGVAACWVPLRRGFGRWRRIAIFKRVAEIARVWVTARGECLCGGRGFRLCFCGVVFGMRIDSYEFGRVVIEGAGFTNDVIIVGGAVHGEWWRKEGHVIRPEDLRLVIEAGPSILVVGCGAYGMCKVAERARQVLEAEGIEGCRRAVWMRRRRYTLPAEWSGAGAEQTAFARRAARK